MKRTSKPKSVKLTLSIDEFTSSLIKAHPEINVSGIVRWAMPIFVKTLSELEPMLVDAVIRTAKREVALMTK